MNLLYLVLGLGLIFVAAELFTNAIEWFGKHLRLSEGAVGSVFAAVGTALPETSVPLVAFIKGGGSNEEAGIGAIVGAPMMLSTLAMLVTGLAVLIFAAKGRRGKDITADYRIVGRDLRWFFLVYLMALAAALIPHSHRPAKLAIAGALVLSYAYYVYLTITCRDREDQEGEMRPLHFARKVARPKLRFVVTQLLASLVVLVVGARTFVDSVTSMSTAMGVSALVLSAIITPIATELPEKLNSITWMRRRKDTLALGNITGAMVFQSCIPAAVGILFTKWQLNTHDLTSVAIALVSAAILYLSLLRTGRLSPFVLLAGAVGYVVFLTLALS